MLKGAYNHTIDAKGRVTIPARFRNELGDTFVVTRGLEHCLAAYSYERWQRIEEKLSGISLTNKAQQKLSRLILGNAIECEVDRMGRILITQSLRNLGGLSKDVTLVGQGERIEIWDKDTWESFNSVDAFDEMTPEEYEKLEELDL